VNATQIAAKSQEGIETTVGTERTDLAVASSSGAAAVERTPNRANLADDQSVEEWNSSRHLRPTRPGS
jgi:hypothetical protein